MRALLLHHWWDKELFWYKDLYVFADWIYTGTDSSPKWDKVLNYTWIRWAFFDRVYQRLYLACDSWFGYYNKDWFHALLTNNSESGSVVFAFLNNYILFSWWYWTTDLYVFNRGIPSLARSIACPTGNYSWKNITQTYYQDERYVPLWHWYAATQVYDIITWNNVSTPFWWNYHQATNFGDMVLITCENWWQNFYMYPQPSWTSWRPISWSNMAVSTVRITDSWLIDKVKSTDWEYDKVMVCWVRNNWSSRMFQHSNVSSAFKSFNARVWYGIPMKYNDTYCIFLREWWFSIYDKTNDTYTLKDISRRAELWITQYGNIWISYYWLVDISWNAVYTSTDFRAAISSKVF